MKRLFFGTDFTFVMDIHVAISHSVNCISFINFLGYFGGLIFILVLVFFVCFTFFNQMAASL